MTSQVLKSAKQQLIHGDAISAARRLALDRYRADINSLAAAQWAGHG